MNNDIKTLVESSLTTEDIASKLLSEGKSQSTDKDGNNRENIGKIVYGQLDQLSNFSSIPYLIQKSFGGTIFVRKLLTDLDLSSIPNLPKDLTVTFKILGRVGGNYLPPVNPDSTGTVVGTYIRTFTATFWVVNSENVREKFIDLNFEFTLEIVLKNCLDRKQPLTLNPEFDINKQYAQLKGSKVFTANKAFNRKTRVPLNQLNTKIIKEFVKNYIEEVIPEMISDEYQKRDY